MEVFAVQPVLDNPFFHGLALAGAQCLEAWPPDWPEKYQTWEVARLLLQWKFPAVVGDVEVYNDYPCVNLLFPAFSRRAVARLGETLSGNGELLLLNHFTGAFYFFNCTRLENCLDLEKTPLEKSGKGFYSKLEALFFDPDRIRDLTVFKVRTQPSSLFCTTRFVEQVSSAGLQGFSFLKVWPIPTGSNFFRERRASAKRAKSLRPLGFSRLKVTGQSMVIRLFTATKKPGKAQVDQVGAITHAIRQKLLAAKNAGPAQYAGNLEAVTKHTGELRLHLSTPDHEKLAAVLQPMLAKTPWPGPRQVGVSQKEWSPQKLNKDCKYLKME